MSLADTSLAPAPAVEDAIVRSRATRLAAILAMAGAAVGFAIAYVASEQPAYYWDWTNYFDRYRDFGTQFDGGGPGWLGTLARTIATSDYNAAVLTPLLPTHALFGDRRIAYIATIVALYLVPAAWMAAKLATRLASRRSPDAQGLPPLWLVAAALLFWPFWIASLRGMPDAAGLVPLGAATLLCIETRFLTRASLAQGLALGLLVWLSFLLRRWYAYADVALEGWCLLFAAGTALRADRATLHRTALAYAANLAALVALLATLQGPLVARILQTSYAEMYAGYQKPLGETAALFFAQTGLAVLLATAAGIARAVRTRNVAALFVAALPATTAVLFLRTQAPSVQHILPVCFWMFPIAVYGICGLYPAAGRRVPILIVTVLLAGFVAVLVPVAPRLTALARPLLPWDAYPPLRLDAPRAYAALIGDLEARLAAAPGARVAVFASSPHLSGSLLGSLEPRLRPALADIGDVDARDGFRLAPFQARFAVVTAAPALHLPPDSQRVVAIPAAMILRSVGPGRAYRRVGGPFALDDGLEAFVFERERPSAADIEAWTHAIQAAYPTWVRHGDLVR